MWSRFQALNGYGKAFLIGFLVFALAAAFTTFSLSRTFFVTTTSFSLPGLAISDSGQGGGDAGSDTSGAVSEPAQQIGPDLEPWDGASRVTILVMGLDYRDWQAADGPPRTDSMILLTVDPVTLESGMLSIPRDLWVEVPGFGHQKINSAYQLGEAHRLPGGGAGLAVDTVEDFLGITINYYALINFNAFVEFVDHIGGVKINLEEDTKIQLTGSDQWTTLQTGVQTLNGDFALAFARTRKSEDGDFDRARRQQQLIVAFRDQLLRSDVQVIIFRDGLELYQELSGGVETNMGFQEMLRLGLLALDIDAAQIQRGVISFESDMVVPDKSPDGLDILKPITENIRILRDQVFSTGSFRSQLARSSDAATLMRAEAASVAIYNGSNTGGLVESASAALTADGMNVIQGGNADAVGGTTIYDFTGNPYTVAYLVEVLGISHTRIYYSYDPNSQVGVQVILGPDYTGP